MRILLYFCTSLLAGLCAQALPVFTTNGLPCQIGESNCSYYSTNVNVAAMLALATTNSGPVYPGQGTNVAQYWNFSATQQSNESVYRVDIIAPEDGADSGNFPDATYAEQDTLEPTNVVGWAYYGSADSGTNTGRLCYGLDAPEQALVTDWAVFVPPTVDIPSTVQFGQTWGGSLYWMNYYFVFIPVSNYYSFSATADAFGTLNLPEIGEVFALRVHEVDSYISCYPAVPSPPLEVSTNQYDYWLVPGLGVAAQVLLLGNNTAYPSIQLPYTNTVQRMYYASYFTNTGPPQLPPFATDLFIHTQGGSAVLNWSNFSIGADYRVDYTASLRTNWQALGYTTNTAWTDTISSVQRFYRVTGTP